MQKILTDYFRPLLVIYFSLDLTLKDVVASAELGVEKHLELGKQFLAQGQLNDALHHYDEAIRGDPLNYLSYFKRATVYLAIGRAKSALPDLNKVIQLKPDFKQAKMERGNILLKLGKLTDALDDFESLAAIGHPDGQSQLEVARPIVTFMEEARHLVENNNYDEAIPLLTDIIEKCPWSVEMRELRARCYEYTGDFHSAILDLRPTTKLVSDNTAAHLKISHLHYHLGEAEESLREIRECLRLDPDHQLCYPHYKKVKKLQKQLKGGEDLKNEQRFEEAIEKFQAALTTESSIYHYKLTSYVKICECYSKLNMFDETLEWCGKAIEMDQHNADALCARAEAYITQEMFEEAIHDYQTAKDSDHHPQKVDDGLNRAQKLLKQSQKRDYYKILGVKRTASKQEITKAYRKLAKEWHPDRHSGADKEKAEKKFVDIAAAKEVLTDPEKREKFDNGEDPLDPEEQHGPNPFNPFGAGQGFTFKFHFG
ncbi:dnaJ homolog subfamily C member 3-like [Dysidea avara]|uniref:dnaJ homolog subfamily C member 3-like n=1 Tax=Dysidea avara TaxID=196820 RepID=UPI00331EA993